MQDSLTVIVHTTSRCNLNCGYCFCHMQEQPSASISFDTFAACLSKIDSYLDPETDVVLLFHGGEPLLLGRGFFQRALPFVRAELRPRYHVGIQTNLTLLDERFIRLFKQYDCQIGTSLDGSRRDHDRYRRDAGGKGSYHRVSKNLTLMKEMGMRYGIASVVSDQNVGAPGDFYSFLKEHPDSPITLNPMFLAKGDRVFAVDPHAFGLFLVGLYNRWQADGTPPHITLFENIVKSFLSVGSRGVCTFHPDCTRAFFTFDAEGNVYNCCHFVGRKEFSYGNLLCSPFADIVDARVRRTLSQRAVKVSKVCHACAFWGLCHGGCMAHTLADICSRDFYCRSYKMIFEHIKTSLEAALPAVAID